MDFVEENLNVLIIISIVVIALCFAGIFILISFTREKKDNKVKVFDSINNQIKEHKKTFFNYDRISTFLDSHGVPYNLSFMADPLRFIFISLFCGAAGFFLGSFIDTAVSILFFVGFLFLPMGLVIMTDKKDNEEILEDIKFIYNVLYNQIKAGVYISDALLECSSGYGSDTMIKNKRLLGEMQKLSSEIFLTSNIKEALRKFTTHFNNFYITSLGIVIEQSLDSGLASEALYDITEQLKEVEKNLLIVKRDRKQTQNTFFQLGFLFGIVLTMFVFIFPTLVSMMSGL